MNVEAPNPDGSNPNPAGGGDATQGNANAPQGDTGKALATPEGQGAAPDDANKDGKAADPPKEGDKPADGKAEDKPAEGAPEQYETFTLPPDFELEGERLTRTVDLFKRAGLSQAEAQAQIDAYTDGVKLALGNQQAALVDDWGKQLKADPEFGGAGFDANLAVAGKYVAEVGGPKLIEDLNAYGLGNLPSLNKFVLAAARREAALVEKLRIATGEPQDVPGNGVKQSDNRTLAQRMYPDLK